MALVLAVALWGHVRGEVNPLETATFTVKVSPAPPQGWALQNAGAVPRNVRVTLRAPRNSLRDLKGGVSVNPLVPAEEAPPLSSRVLSAHLDFPVLKAGASTATIKVDSDIEDAEVIGVKPNDVVVSLVKLAR